MPIMLEAVMRVRASKGAVNYYPLAQCDLPLAFRFTDGIIPWKLLCQIYRPSCDASCAHGPIICH